MKFYNLIFLLSLSALFALNNAQESPKNSTVVDNQINAGYILYDKITEFYKNSYIRTVFDGFIAKKDIFVYFKERMINRSILTNISDANDYQAFTTNISTALDSVIGLINFDFNDLNSSFAFYWTGSNLNSRNNVIGATVSLKNIIDNNITAYDCFMNDYRSMISNKFNEISTAQKNSYKSSIATIINATSEFVQVVEKFIISIEDRLDYCTGISLDSSTCLNNYATFTGQNDLIIVQTYLTDLNKNATLFLTEGDGELSIQEKSMIEVILTVESKTKECAKM